MLIKNIEAANTIRVKIGDSTIYITKIGARSTRLAVDAPKEFKISIDNDDHPPVNRRGG